MHVLRLALLVMWLCDVLAASWLMTRRKMLTIALILVHPRGGDYLQVEIYTEYPCSCCCMGIWFVRACLICDSMALLGKG
jgi:hypothetical protein